MSAPLHFVAAVLPVVARRCSDDLEFPLIAVGSCSQACSSRIGWASCCWGTIEVYLDLILVFLGYVTVVACLVPSKAAVQLVALID